MSTIRGKNTKFEEIGFLLLKETGVRFRKHPRGIYGNPDAANKKKKIAFFFDSHFWHGYDEGRTKAVKNNKKFWRKKIANNIQRDKKVNRILREDGWLVIRFWEHDLMSSRRSMTLAKIKKILRISNSWH